MHRVAVLVCLLGYSAYGSPQRGVQLGGGPRPVTFAGSVAPQQPSFGPSYTQQLTFGPSDASSIRGRLPGGFQSPKPIVLQQGNPTTAPQAFPSFQSSTPFSALSPGRTPILRNQVNSAVDDDEYEEYEDEEEAPKTFIQASQRPVQRTPVRISQQSPLSQAPQRLVVPQTSRTAAARQRQPVPQRATIPSNPFANAAPSPQRAAPPPSRGQQVASYGIDGKRSRLTTPPPIQTVNRYMRQNDDGSITWGYENEDGTFKEETIGADCVVRGKYGYVDPDGQKREYEYQSGNPCDPNKKDEEEFEDYPEGPGQQQQLAGVINARPRPRPVAQRRPVPVPQYQPEYAQ